MSLNIIFTLYISNNRWDLVDAPIEVKDPSGRERRLVEGPGSLRPGRGDEGDGPTWVAQLGRAGELRRATQGVGTAHLGWTPEHSASWGAHRSVWWRVDPLLLLPPKSKIVYNIILVKILSQLMYEFFWLTIIVI